MRLRNLALFLFALMVCGPAAAAPSVLVTIKPVHSLVAEVMDGIASPSLLIAGAASEHSYVLKPSDARKIAAAKVIFWIGPDLETYLKTPLRNLAPDARIVALENVKGLRRLAARPGGLWTTTMRPRANANINPHVWLDPANAVVMLHVIAATLSAIDPAHAAKYMANTTAATHRLETLDARLAHELAPVRKVPYVVFHDAYAYFEDHYGLNAIGAVTVEPDRPVGPRRIMTLRRTLEKGRATCIFREPQFSPALIRTLATGTKVRIGVLDPLGADLVPGPDLYPTLLQRMAKALVDCLAAHS